MKILVADDEDPIRVILSNELIRLGHYVTVVENGIQAVTKLREEQFNVAILDIDMPGLSGLGVLEIARRDCDTTDFVILTGKATVANAIEAFRGGVFDFLQKPAALREIVSVLDRIEEKQSAIGCISRETEHKHYSVFLSYRRKDGSDTARAIRAELTRNGHATFLDVVDLGGSYFDDQLLARIETTRNFVVVLTPDCLIRRNSNIDWFYWEVEHAVRSSRNIIPVLKDDFQFPEDSTPSNEIYELRRHNSVRYSHEYFEAMISKIQRFLSSE